MRLRPLVVLVVLALFTLGCVGQEMRERALVPAVTEAWKSVAVDVQRGIDDGFEDGDLSVEDAAELKRQFELVSAAINTGTADTQTSLVWSGLLMTWARRGVQDRIDDGELGPGGAASFNERHDQLTEALALLVLPREGAFP